MIFKIVSAVFLFQSKKDVSLNGPESCADLTCVGFGIFRRVSSGQE